MTVLSGKGWALLISVSLGAYVGLAVVRPLIAVGFAAAAAVALLIEWSTRGFRRVVRYALAPIDKGVREASRVASLRRVSVVRDVADAINPSWAASATTSLWGVWLRSMLGRRGLYVSVSPRDITTRDAFVAVVTDGISVHFHGLGPLVGQVAAVDYSPPLAADATVGMLWLKRHLSVDVEPASPVLGGCISYATYSPGPLHWCTSQCRHHGARLAGPPLAVKRYGDALVLLGPNESQLSWRHGQKHVTVESQRLLDVITRYNHTSKTTQYHVLSSGLNAPEAFPLVMHAVAAGLHYRNAPPAPAVSECVVAITTAVPDFSGRPLDFIAVHPPIVDTPAMVLMSGEQAMRRSVKDRVLSNASKYVVTDDDAKDIAEFARRFMDGRRLTPWPIEAVEEILLPHQREEFESLNTVWDTSPNRFSIFIKAEAMKADKAPRIIVAGKGASNVRLSSFTRALYEHAARFSCWGAGRTPAETEAAVHAFHARCRTDGVAADETDFTSFDASLGALGVAVEFAVFDAAFREYAGEGFEELRRAFCAPAAAKFGNDDDGEERRSVRMGIGTYSGRANTTLRNTLFHMYVEFRKARHIGLGFDAAWSHVLCCLFSGDDGLVRSLGHCSYGALEGTGLICKSRVYSTGHTHFLGRMYIDPWNVIYNVACAKRVLSKLHLVHVPQGRSSSEAMVQRALGCLVSDPDTPILSAYWRACLRARPGVIALDPAFFDSYEFARISCGNSYTSVGADRHAVIEAYASVLSVRVDALVALELDFEERNKGIAIPGVEYNPLCPVILPKVDGMVVDGFPVYPSSLARPPSVKRPQADVDDEEDNARSAALSVAIAMDGNYTASGVAGSNPGIDPPTCANCAAVDHPTIGCPAGLGLSPVAAAIITPPDAGTDSVVEFGPALDGVDDVACDRCLSFYHSTDACRGLLTNAQARRARAEANAARIEAQSLLPGPTLAVAVEPDELTGSARKKKPRGSRGAKKFRG